MGPRGEMSDMGGARGFVYSFHTSTGIGRIGHSALVRISLNSTDLGGHIISHMGGHKTPAASQRNHATFRFLPVWFRARQNNPAQYNVRYNCTYNLGAVLRIWIRTFTHTAGSRVCLI